MHLRSSRIHIAITKIILGMFATVSILPTNALAFEHKLTNSRVQRFVAHVDIQGRDTKGQFSSLAVVAPSSPVTIAGDWNVRKFAKAQHTVSRTLALSSNAPVILEGTASFYSREGCLGCNPLRIMANGQPLDDNALTIAVGADNKHLVGYKARITSLATGKSIDVTITDTGGFHDAQYGHRVADMTIATKQAIGMIGGVGQVRVEVY